MTDSNHLPEVNALDKTCPVPLIMTKKVYDEIAVGDQMVTLVNNPTSAENVERYILENGGSVVKETDGEVQRLVITRGADKITTEARCGIPAPGVVAAPHVVYVDSDCMGRGSDELGQALMKAFINTIKDVRPLPEKLLFVNSGVKLTIADSPVLASLKELESAGVVLRSCGTCLDYFGLMDQLAVGKVTNMYEILDALTQAGHVVKP